jgi:hypothetical protein
MISNKKSGRIVGALFLLTILIGIGSLNLRGLSTSLSESPTFLNDIFENTAMMKIAMLLDIIAGLISVGTAIVLFPIIKKYKQGFALWYFGLYVSYFGLILLSNLNHLSLLSLSEQFVNTKNPDFDYFNILGLLQIESYFSVHFFSLIIFSLAAVVLYYFLYKTMLLPRFLCIWGILAATIVFASTWLQIFDYDVNFIVYAQNGIFMLFFTIWLLVKGFNSSSLVFPTVETVNN